MIAWAQPPLKTEPAPCRPSRSLKPGFFLVGGARTSFFGLACCLLPQLIAPAAVPPVVSPPFIQTNAVYGKLPFQFEANRGQADPRIKFLARGRGCAFYLGAADAVILLDEPPLSGAENPASAKANRAGRAHPPVKLLRMELAGANPGARVAGLEPLPGKVNYFIGSDPAHLLPDIPTFAKLWYAEVYPGVSLSYYGSDQQLEYDFILAPGADPDAIALRIEGVDQLQIDARGDLWLSLGTDQIRHHKPLIYQMVDGVRTEIEGGYRLKDGRTVGFRLSRYDPGKPLVIDPVLSYSTYLGGNSGEIIWDMAVDASGSAYIAGETMSVLTNLVTPGALQTSFAGGTGVFGDAFVAKLNPTGSALVYLTYLGGKTDDSALAIALDGQGNAYLTGFTDSTNFPTTPGAFQSKISGVPEVNFGLFPVEAFVAKLNPNGS